METNFKKQFEKINNILMRWNPLGIEGPSVEDEYASYIPQIIKLKNNKEQLLKYMEDFLNELSVGYDPNDLNHKDDLLKIIAEIQKV